ncbi:DUF5343 domain-containing protein [Tunturibacter empetritectus]|uniref:DUF5343 domain-containing protein n=1 Tax=Tunturiibacter empetritectus TaxID=3069691 RepID=A0A7W8IHX1_9BACT|nr:DUF5343 domain-containing protein [Edaphobacter lichenicola]MBB5317461.1 hypothetical protein [Edaphobacter lichenicola]
MADKHPYISGNGAIVQLFDQLKKSFPQVLNAEVLKKLSIAPSNESYAMNIVRFLGLIDESGKATPNSLKVFTLHDEKTFQTAFSEIIEKSYHELFSLHGSDAWMLPLEQLIPFFRQTDQSSSLVGSRQASTFKALAAYAGHGALQSAATNRPPKVMAKKVPRVAKKPDEVKTFAEKDPIFHQGKRDDRVGLTVRIEVNLPAAGDQETYDRIFKSIKENLING